MPVDPRTGQSLPYPGEPGYEEAAAAGGPGGAPPMGPEGAMSPPAPGPEGGALPSADDVMSLEGEEAAMRVEQVAAMAPQPSKPYSKKAIETLAKEFNEAVEALGGGELPDVEPNLDAEKGAKWNQPLPPDIFVPLYALSEALKMIPDPEVGDKYAFDPLQLTDDPALRKLSGQLSKMSGDKNLVESMSAPMGGGEEEEMMPPPEPGAMTEDDEILAACMA